MNTDYKHSENTQKISLCMCELVRLGGRSEDYVLLL